MRIKGCICYIPVILLVAVALLQLFLAHASGLAPWSGGGFGMFSTPDAAQSRHMHVYAVSPGIRREVEIPFDLRGIALRTLALPTESNLKRLARKLSKIPTPEGGAVGSIIIQVWKTDYNPVTLMPSGSMVRSLEVELDSH
jgi:hypothetical protein